MGKIVVEASPGKKSARPTSTNKPALWCLPVVSAMLEDHSPGCPGKNAKPYLKNN
jgi:hypothetical protein